jgi:tetratricopeptide (TPR) repeat protein/transcriptional regulator with XRE-family HTH domain
VPDSTPDGQEQQGGRSEFQAKRQEILARRAETAAGAGQVLRAWRTGAGLSQNALAKEAFVSEIVVRRVEKGDYGPVPVTLIAAVQKLGGPARELRESAQTLEDLKHEFALLRRSPVPQVLQDYAEQPTTAGDRLPAGTVIVGRRPNKARAFQQRSDLMAALAASGPDAPVVRALTGMHGVGKSQLAAEYARSRIDAGWRLVAWISARDSAQMLSGLADVAAALELDAPDAEGLAQAVRRRLEEDGDQCLLVFDDAADLGGLEKVLPSAGQSHVVVTSNYAQAAAFGLHVPVGVFADAQALSFLARRTGREEAEAAELAASVGFLPLALAQAAAVIAEQQLNYPTFLGRLRKIPVQRYLARATGEPYPVGVGEVIALALDTAAAADRTSVTRKLVSLVALLSGDGVPRSLLHAAGLQGLLGQSDEEPGAEPEAVDEALGKLASASLLSFSDDGAAVTGHPLTLRVARECAADGAAMTGMGAGAASLLGEIATSISDPSRERHAARDTAKQVLGLHEHLLCFPAGDTRLAPDLLLLRCWAMDTLVKLNDSFFQVVEYGPLVVADCEQMLGLGDAATLHARTSLANGYYQAGQFDAAASTARQNLAACRQALGDGHKETLSVRHTLALALEDAGNVREAIPEWEQLLADRERELGAGDDDTISTRNDLAHAYEKNLELGKLVPMREALLEDCIRKYGPEHEYTVGCRNNLARAYELTGRPDEATPLYEQALESFEQTLGADHPYSLQCRHNVAGAYRTTGRLPEAIALYERVIGERERKIGESHPDTLKSWHNLALALLAADRPADAVLLLEQTVADRERVLGSSHPDTVTSREALDLACRAAGTTSGMPGQ